MVPIRHAGRILLLDERDRVLLFRFHDLGASRDHLASPGGGVEGAESYEEAALREMAEELLIDDVALGPAIWHRTSEFEFLGTWTRFEERFFLVTIAASRLAPYEGHLAGENVVGREWWTLEEIERSDEEIWPSDLASLVRHLVANGPPTEPLAIGP